MEEEIKFIDKEIARLEEIQRKTYYRLSYFRRIKLRIDEKERIKPVKVTQLEFFGT